MELLTSCLSFLLNLPSLIFSPFEYLSSPHWKPFFSTASLASSPSLAPTTEPTPAANIPGSKVNVPPPDATTEATYKGTAIAPSIPIFFDHAFSEAR